MAMAVAFSGVYTGALSQSSRLAVSRGTLDGRHMSVQMTRPAACHLQTGFVAARPVGGFSTSLTGVPVRPFTGSLVFPMTRGARLVVRAGGTSMACTKRSASRKKRARVHGFRARMSSKDGQVVLKRRRTKGRWVLCTQTNSPTGKRRT